MNRYGRLAYDHTRLHRPRAFAAMADPAAHFTALGSEVEGQITELRDRLLGAPGAGESLEEYHRRSYQVRRQAEEVVLAEAVWTAPEPATERRTTTCSPPARSWQRPPEAHPRGRPGRRHVSRSAHVGGPAAHAETADARPPRHPR